MQWNTNRYDATQWKKWYAWHPVYCCDIDKMVWLETVNRRVVSEDWGGVEWQFTKNACYPNYPKP